MSSELAQLLAVSICITAFILAGVACNIYAELKSKRWTVVKQREQTQELINRGSSNQRRYK